MEEGMPRRRPSLPCAICVSSFRLPQTFSICPLFRWGWRIKLLEGERFLDFLGSCGLASMTFDGLEQWGA